MNKPYISVHVEVARTKHYAPLTSMSLLPPSSCRSSMCCLIFRVLARTIYVRCIFGVFGREVAKYTVHIYGSGQLYWYCMGVHAQAMVSQIFARGTSTSHISLLPCMCVYVYRQRAARSLPRACTTPTQRWPSKAWLLSMSAWMMPWCKEGVLVCVCVCMCVWVCDLEMSCVMTSLQVRVWCVRYYYCNKRDSVMFSIQFWDIATGAIFPFMLSQDTAL